MDYPFNYCKYYKSPHVPKSHHWAHQYAFRSIHNTHTYVHITYILNLKMFDQQKLNFVEFKIKFYLEVFIIL